MWFKIIKDEDYERYLDETIRDPTSENLTGESDFDDYDDLVNIAFVNFDFGDIDNKAWKTVGEEPQGDYTIRDKMAFIKKALFSYDFIELSNVRNEPEKLQLRVSPSSPKGFNVRVDRNVQGMNRLKEFEFNLTDKTQNVVNTVLHHHLKRDPELRARDLLNEIINDPEIDARIESGYVIVKGKPSNRIYKIPLNWTGDTCGLLSNLPWYRRSRENVLEDKTSLIAGKTFEDLTSADVDVRLCIKTPKGNLPSGDKVGGLVKALQDEENARKSINVLDAFLKVDDVPDHWTAYAEGIPVAIDINHEDAAPFLTGERAHPFRF